MQLDLIITPECDHLPVGQRIFVNGNLVCGRCKKLLRIITKEQK